MLQKRLQLLAGLGNPGDTYAKTRHNIGFMVLDEVARFFSISLDKKKFNAEFGRGRIKDIELVLVKPMAFMNASGPPVRNIAQFFRILYKDMLIVHDDIDLAFGRLKIKEKGGDGGHKGVRSLIDAFGGGDFIRLRVGVGRPGAGISAADYVLKKFNPDEKIVLDQIVARARDAVVTTLCYGTKEGMDRFNDKKIVISS